MTSPRRIGVFGGTFDPPHLGHLAVARASRDQLGLDEVRLVVAGDPWQKRDRELAPAWLRYELTEMLVAGEAKCTVDDREIRRQGATFSIDTIEEMLGEASEELSIYLIVGVDAAAGISLWHRANDLAALVTLTIAPRPQCAPLTLDPSWRVEYLQGLDNPCASTDLRASGLNEAFRRQCLPNDVFLRITQEGLYAVDNGN